MERKGKERKWTSWFLAGGYQPPMASDRQPWPAMASDVASHLIASEACCDACGRQPPAVGLAWK